VIPLQISHSGCVLKIIVQGGKKEGADELHGKWQKSITF